MMKLTWGKEIPSTTVILLTSNTDLPTNTEVWTPRLCKDELIEKIEKYFLERQKNPKFHEQIFWSDVSKDIINIIKNK